LSGQVLKKKKTARREILQNLPHDENKQTSDTSDPIANLQSEDKSILWSAVEECFLLHC